MQPMIRRVPRSRCLNPSGSALPPRRVFRPPAPGKRASRPRRRKRAARQPSHESTPPSHGSTPRRPPSRRSTRRARRRGLRYRVRAGADPGTHLGRPLRRGRAAARAAGSSRCRMLRCGRPRSQMAYRDTSVSVLCNELGIKPVTLHRLRRSAGRVARAGREAPRHLNESCGNLDVGRARAQPSKWRPRY